MSRWICGLCLSLLLAGGSVIPILGCGDKFLIVSRGTRYQRAPLARDPAGILIYTSPSSDVSKALAGIPVDATLRQAGYHLAFIDSPAELDRALSKGGWDLVLAGLADAEALSRRSTGATFLPVVLNPSTAALKETRKQFPVVLKGPAKSQALLDAVDEALSSRAKVSKKTNKAAI